MKKNRLGWLLGLAVILTAGSLQALGSFEGEVDYSMKSKDTEGAMAYLLKGKKMRVNMEMKGHSSAMIMDLGTRKTIMLMPEQKMYMVSSIPESKADAKKFEGKFSKTGKTQEILGHHCDEWLYQGKESQVSTWCASGMGAFMGMGQQGKNMSAEAWVEAVKHKGLFPLKTEVRDKDGNNTMTMEATKIDKRSVSSSEFEPPAGYKKINMPSFGGDGSGKKPSKEDIMKMMEQFKK
jgi:hypothetical protein